MSEEYLRSQLEDSRQGMVGAAKMFTAVQEGVGASFLDVLEKLALYSAGIVSLSVTFIGYLVSNKLTILSSALWGVPLRYVLFLSWFLLVVSMLAGLFARWFHAGYRHANAGEEYMGKRRLFFATQDEYIKSGFEVRTDPGLSAEDYVKQNEGVIAQAQQLVDDFSKVKKTRWDIYYCLALTCRVAFVVGVVALALFSSLVVEGLSRPLSKV